MNREIKFRAWDNENKYMVTSKQGVFTALRNSMNIVRQDDGYYNDGDLLKPNKEKYSLMEFTGLHDKNGKEIYEGDIIEFSYDVFTGNFDTKVGRGTIEFIDGAFYIKPFEIEGRKVKDTDNEEWFLLYTVNTDTLEVIGNVHENLELLGGEDE